MKDFLMHPFKLAREEIRKNKQLIKKSESHKLKVGLRPFIYMSYMFMVVIFGLYLSVPYYFIGGIFITPIALLGMIPSVIMIWMGVRLYKNVYPKTKENFLKSIDHANEKQHKTF